MSVPLPRIDKYKCKGDSPFLGNHVNSFFLDSEERYEIYVVKSAERPQLVAYSNTSNGESSNDDETLPITDGCDLPGWRKEDIALDSSSISDEKMSLFYVGPSCTMFRRESQWTVIHTDIHALSTNHLRSAWEEKLHTVPKDSCCETIDYQSLKLSVWNRQYETKNEPVKLLNATLDWSCMPNYGHHLDKKNTDINTIQHIFSGGGVGGWT